MGTLYVTGKPLRKSSDVRSVENVYLVDVMICIRQVLAARVSARDRDARAVASDRSDAPSRSRSRTRAFAPSMARVNAASARISLRDFESDDFDRARWINERARGAPFDGRDPASGSSESSSMNLERFLADLELQVQLLSEDLSASLDEQSREATTRVPRATREIELVESRVKALHDEVKGVLVRLEEVEEESRTSVEALRQLDAARQRMESAKDTLQEASGLADLMSNIDGIFASGNIRNMSEALARMKRALAVVGDVPEFADGQDKVNAFEHKLETIVRPALVTALESNNSTAAREHRDVLLAIGRGSALESAYTDTRVMSRVKKQWKTRDREASTASEGKSDADVRMLDEFLKFCSATLREEISWCSSTFPDNVASLIPVAWCSIHAALEGSITEKLSVMTIEQLVPIRQAFESYTEDVKIQLMKLVSGTATKAAPDIIATINDALMATVEPMIAIEQRYGELALAKMRRELESMVSFPEARSVVTSDDLTSIAHDILSTLPKAMSVFDAAVDRCIDVTAGVEMQTCMHAVEGGMEHYADLISLVVRDLRHAAGLIDSSASNTKPNVTSAGEEFIRGSLSLLDMINALPAALLDFEANLRAKMLSLRSTLRPALDVAELSGAPTGRALVALSVTAHASRSRKLATFLDKIADAAEKHALDGSMVPVGVEHMNALTRTLEKFVNDTLLGRVALELKGIGSSEVWSAKPAESAYKLPTFSAYPQERVTNAGEYLLSLPQHLDGANDEEASRVTAPNTDSSSSSSEDWIAKIAESSAELLLKEVGSIQKLTEQGAAQLAVDLEYFSNIVAALSLEPPGALSAWCKCVSAPRDEYEAFARSAASAGMDIRIARDVAAKRGITISI